MRTCERCDRELPPRGRVTVCHSCQQKDYRDALPIEVKRERWRNNWNRMPLEKRQEIRRKTNAAITPEQYERHRDAQYAKRYGLTVDEYREMRQRPCAICGTKPKKRRIVVDHDHSDGTIRDVLCLRCNLALGQFGEDTRRLANAIAYLERHKREPKAMKEL